MPSVQQVAVVVSRLKPGQAIDFDKCFLQCLTGYRRTLFGPIFSVVDQIMEKIVGSSYNITIHTSPITEAVTFYRLENELLEGTVAYVSPDRRHYYYQEGDFWKLKSSQPVTRRFRPV